jgi:hypothetical protein
MRRRRGAVRLLLPILAIGFAALVPECARAADCFAPLAANDKWACTEEIANVGLVSYCLNVTGSSGEGAERIFGIHTPGSAPRTCTCGAKGKGPSARHNAANTYLCLDDARDLVEGGTITRKKIAAEIYIVGTNSRSTVTCRPDPACLVLQ